MAQHAGRPPAKYRQIADDLRARIERGDYPIGAQLPTKAELSVAHGAAVGTVDAALSELRDLGLTETRQGSGTFVIAQHPGESEAQQLSEQVASLRAQVAELAKRVEAAEDAGLRDIVSRIEANLIELYGRSGQTYPEDGEPGPKRQDRKVGHG